MKCLRLVPILFLLFLFATKPVLAVDSLETVGLESPAATESISPKLPRPASKIAENVTVISREQIERLNAHTLTDILVTVTGIQVDSRRTPGSNQLSLNLNSMDIQHILLLLDGVPQNAPMNNFADPSLIPAGIIERVEIIKGASSAAWGGALGGIINVVTKSPDNLKKVGGTLSGSFGERKTSDLNGEISGTVDRVGYYLQGGNLYSLGLMPGTAVNAKNLFSKLNYRLPGSGLLTLSGNLFEGTRGIEEHDGLDFRDTELNRNYGYNLSLLQPLAPGLSLLIAADRQEKTGNVVLGQITTTPPYSDIREKSQSHGAKAELVWKDSGNSVTVGGDYRNLKITNSSSIYGVPNPDFDSRIDRYSLYLNGSSEIGRLTLLPGIRFDNTGNSGENLSYALGATFKLSSRTIARVYSGSGYGLPMMDTNVNNGILQKIRTAQVGIESSELPYVWLKGTVFYNQASNIQVPVNDSNGNFLRYDGHSEIRQGYELEIKSLLPGNFSVGAGYTWINSYDQTDGNRKPTYAPTNSLKLTIDYKNLSSGSSIILLGNYVWWNDPDVGADGPSRYTAVVWDMQLNQKLLPSSENSPELFLSGHNLFNGAQYYESLYKNAGRWVEGGVRFRF